MIGNIVISHSDFSKGLKSSIEMIMGPNEKFEVLSFYEEDNFEDLKDKLFSTAKKLDDGQGVLIFVDLLGATPYNICAMCMHEFEKAGIKVRVISGVNLAMVIESLMKSQQASCQLDSLYPEIIKVGMDNIKEMKEELSK